MESCRNSRDKDGFLENKKRVRDYKKSTDVLESSQKETRKRLHLVNRECARRRGDNVDGLEESSSDSEVSETGF
jgi:hypothetical protein